MDVSFAKRIYSRIFPTEKIDCKNIKFDTSLKKIFVRHLQELSKNWINREPSFWEFKTDGVFFNATQEKVYNEVMDGVLERVLNGDNAIILSYGQVGTGKTFTTSGLHITEDEFGILPRIAKDIFKLKEQKPINIKIGIQMSYAEFYNTYAIDLLQSQSNVVETCKCRNIKRVHVRNELEALKCIFIAEGRKNFIEKCKYLSNLSTSVATIHILRKDMDLTNPIRVSSRIHIVDVAGNESGMKIGNICRNLKQIGLANVTKSQLEQFVLCLKENIPENIRLKQRTNALMYYLNGDFSHESILRFIAHIQFNTEHLMITLSMLRFGNIVKGLKMNRKIIKFEMNDEIELEHLRRQLRSIEKEKHLNSVLFNQDLVSGLNCERINHLQNLITDYLNNRIREVTILNVADANVFLQGMRTICHEYQEDVRKLQMENQTLLAQQQNEVNLKQRGSKSSSQGSGGKISRKSSKAGSKDSISKLKSASGSNVSKKQIKTEGYMNTKLSLTSSKRKKSLKSSTSGFKPAQSKRKSSNTSIEKRDSKNNIEVSLLIPDILPEKVEMWKRFSLNNSYKQCFEDYKINEKDVKSSCDLYIHETKKLHNLREAIAKYNSDLLAAQTYRKFNEPNKRDANGQIIKSFAEKDCMERLDEAKGLLSEQQEKVLTTQETLKVYLENRRNIISRMEEEFNQFCIDNFHMPNADVSLILNDLNSHTVEVNLDQEPDDVDQEKEILFVPEPSNSVKKLKNLQKLMMYERRKKQFQNRKVDWRNV
ncbi:hypothetical protein ABEB36_010172 [Hypothenemus hampei]|uniref:Kinesin motor domain-containing protein n=1 Tax=Hypothenemus hampei TaxID=57062 RepID=A0ABD1EIS1_HYPHA